MAKGYWVAHLDISDADAYQEYVKANAEPFAKYGARFLIRASPTNETPEGRLRPRHVVLEFDSYQQALDCYNSPEYQAAKALRDPVSEGDLVIIEGYDGPQPGD